MVEGLVSYWLAPMTNHCTPCQTYVQVFFDFIAPKRRCSRIKILTSECINVHNLQNISLLCIEINKTTSLFMTSDKVMCNLTPIIWCSKSEILWNWSFTPRIRIYASEAPVVDREPSKLLLSEIWMMHRSIWWQYKNLLSLMYWKWDWTKQPVDNYTPLHSKHSTCSNMTAQAINAIVMYHLRQIKNEISHSPFHQWTSGKIDKAA